MTATNEVVSTEYPPAVTFDTLAAAQELRGAGLDDRQAEAIVKTVSKAMSETVATKSDLELQSAAMEKKLELHSAEMKAALELQGTEIRAEMDLLRVKLEGDMKSLRTELKADMAALENRIILKLGGLMVTLTFLLLAVGPFYIRWVLSLMGTS